MRKSLLIVIAVVAGCATTESETVSAPTASAIETNSPYNLSSAERAVVERFVRDRLRDPASAQFGPMAATQNDEGVVTVCGYVNARNAMGGFTGDRPYNGVMIGTGGDAGFAVVMLANNQVEITVAHNVCMEQAGIDLRELRLDALVRQ